MLGRTKKDVRQGKERALGRKGARDFFEKALGLKFGLTIILA